MIHQVKSNIFDIGRQAHFAHCISADAEMGAGIAVHFCKKFHLSPLRSAKLNIGDAKLFNGVFNLVTKKKFYHKPTIENVELCLTNMRDKCFDQGINLVHIPHIASGLDKLPWWQVFEKIGDIFGNSMINIVIHNYNPKQNKSKRFNDDDFELY
jgi:hypothetical protein